MPFIDSSSRVGRSQGASIFWGLVSVFFAAAACFYFLKSHENERIANKYRDQVYTLQDERDTLNAEKEKLQASMSDTAGQMKTREEFLDEKETKLAAQETRIEALAQPSKNPSPSTSSATPIPKKCTDTLRKLSQNDGADLVVHAGRPVLRLPNALLFAPGLATLTPDGEALLRQLITPLDSLDGLEIHVETYSDSGAEADKPGSKPGDQNKKKADADAADKHPYGDAWELTSARAIAITQFCRKQNDNAFGQVWVIAGGDAHPNRRTEFTLIPVPPAFRSTDLTHLSAGADSDSSTNSLTPPADPATPPAKAK